MVKRVFVTVGIVAAAGFAWLLAIALAFGAFEHSATEDAFVVVAAGATVVLALAVVVSLLVVWVEALRRWLGRTR